MTTRDWMDQSTRIFLDALSGLSDRDLKASTHLPGWSRRHLVAHVHFNAEALRRLLTWARTGMETPMYASMDQRNAEIERGATLRANDLRDLVEGSAKALADEMDAMPSEAWSHEVVDAKRRKIPATEIPWMRAREVAVHGVDLDAGIRFDDLPADLIAELCIDVVRKRASGDEGPALAEWLTGRTRHAPKLGPWL
ncbi:MAG: maleylpyruvate isomerase N-terminal domain-containing protein [Actinomycetota bacterium]|nr:maleylpyruvate isomerase N-terminal domain-containing protein [Actinomycetota bacterium]